ncbi:glutamine synthetase [Rickettsiaceae bacterium]|nr:glutamine synthetase [Rickettsiaceae bacterium]
MIFKHVNYIKLPDNILARLQDQFKSEFNLSPCIGAELEFYIHGDIKLNLLEQRINCEIKKERGENQYEINIKPSCNIQEYAEKIKKIREDITLHTEELGAIADFSSKPFSDDYGSSMHIHLNFLEDKNNDIEKYAEILCHYMTSSLDYFLPSPKDYKRLDSNFMAPTHICYGGNNRTAAIRIPDSEPKRLEHRLPSANANPYNVLYMILESIRKGLESPKIITPASKIFGNSFDAQYSLQRIIVK